MKKRVLLVILLAFFCTSILTACNSRPNISGYFTKDEYIISIDSSRDFFEELHLKGVNKDMVKLTSSNESILVSNGNNFTALSSGKAYLLASYNQKLLAQTEVYVKSVLTSPQNITCDDDSGLVSWDKSFAVVEGKSIFAKEYKITYVNEELDINEGTTVEENSFSLPQVGSFDVTIQAISDNKYVDNSKEVNLDINYGVMEELENIRFLMTEEFTQVGRLSWDEIENATIDIYFDGIKIAEKLQENTFSYDFSKFPDGKVIPVTIIINDEFNKKNSSKMDFTITVLETPDFKYTYENGNGLLTWGEIENANSYKLYLKDCLNGNDENSTTLDFSSDETSIMPNIPEGIYDLKFYAVGGEKEGQFFVNSKVAKTLRIGKLPTPEYTTQFEGSTLKLTFTQQDYIENYRIEWEDQSEIFDVKQGLTKELNLSSISLGKHSIVVTALPTADEDAETKVKQFTINGTSAEMVINSESKSFDYFKLADADDITHKFEENTSVLEFSEIENANYYKLFVNDNEVTTFEKTEENGKITLKFENLKNYQPNGNGYDIKIIAGLNRDDVEYAINSQGIKHLEILSPVTANDNDQQPNGSFTWNSLSQDGVLYSYKIYKTGKDYVIINKNEPIQEAVINGTQIQETLKEGYYKIVITSISNDQNSYLDSNFVDEGNVFERNFFVTTILQTPDNVKFEIKDGSYNLVISMVDHAGKYEVYIDDETLDGTPIRAAEGETITYKLQNKFEKEGDFTVKVYAIAGDYDSTENYDSVLYKKSLPYELILTRLSKPEFELGDITEDFAILTGQKIEVRKQDGTKSVRFFLNEEQIEENEEGILEIKQKDKFGTNFKIGITLLAGEGEGNHYYIDSNKKEVNFVRASAPQALIYSNGVLSWNNVDNHLQKLYLSVIFVGKESNYYSRFFTDGVVTKYDIQKFIDEHLSESDFETAYRDCDKIQLELISYGSGKEGDLYYLHSLNAVTLEVVQLDPITLEVKTDTGVISWKKQTEFTIFDIYVNDELIDDFKGYAQNYITLDTLKSKNIDILSDFVKISVIARDSGHFNSDFSKPVYLKQITAPNQVTITEMPKGEYTATIKIEKDSANIGSVEVNGKSENVTFTTGDSSAVINFKDFSSITEFSFVFKAENKSEVYYYFDSQPYVVTIKNLKDSEFNANKEAEKVTWNEVATDLAGLTQESTNPIIYEVVIKNGENSYTYTTLSQELILSEIESIADELSGKVTLQLRAYVHNNYTLSGEGVLGYYGSTLVKQIETEKLEKASNFEITVEDASSGATPLIKKQSSNLKIKFKDVWTALDNLKFDVEIKLSDNTISLKSIQNNSESTQYSLKLAEGYYTLTLKYDDLVKDFSSGETEIEIKVTRETSISSDTNLVTVSKFNSLLEGDIAVSEDGELTISDEQEGASYYIEVQIGGHTYNRIIDQTKKYNLMQDNEFEGSYGSYTINVLVFDNSLPSHTLPSDSMAFEGNKLEGIQSVEIDDLGNINITIGLADLSNIQFIARKGETEVDFTDKAKLREDSANIFYISMLDALKLFDPTLTLDAGEQELYFTIRSTGSIKAGEIKTTFNYAIDSTPELKRTKFLDEDYIIFTLDSSDVKTINFKATIKCRVENVVDENGDSSYKYSDNEITIDFNKLDLIRGAWINDANGGYFSLLDLGEDRQECFGIKIKDLLKDVPFGDVSIEISRIGKKDALENPYFQYNSKKFENYYKLNNVSASEVRINNNVLYINWSQRDIDYEGDTSKEPTRYMAYFIKDDEISNRQLMTSDRLDLRTIGLNTGEEYKVVVRALSKNLSIFASDDSDGVLMTLRFTVPTKLQVKDGKVMFDITEFESSSFMTDIKDFFGSNDLSANPYYVVVAGKKYVTPLYFTPSTLKNYSITLVFTALTEDSGMGKVYTMKVKAACLFPDIKIPVQRAQFLAGGASQSYISLLEQYKKLILDGQSSVAADASNMVQALLDSSRGGIGDNSVLFDDYGREIPAGKYLVTAMQSSYNSYVESDKSEGVELYVSPAPELVLEDEIDAQSNKKVYYARLNTATTLIKKDDRYESVVAGRYKFILRKDRLTGSYVQDLICLLIEKTELDENWSLRLSKDRGLTYEITIPDIVTATDKGFRINLSLFKNKINELSGDTIIDINVKYQVDIFTYINDNGYVLNGKSGIFYLDYLDFQPSDIHVENGIFRVDGKVGDQGVSNNHLLIRYCLQGGSEVSKVVSFGADGRAYVDFTDTGAYTYVIFSLEGSRSLSEIHIESQSYYIKNVYKLTAPDIMTQNNNLLVSYKKEDRAVAGAANLQFNLANNIKRQEDLENSTNNNGYYYSSPLYALDKEGLSNFTYEVYQPNADARVEASEGTATEFYSYLSGNSGEFVMSEETNRLADAVLTFTDLQGRVIRPILTSAESSISAKVFQTELEGQIIYSVTKSNVENGGFTVGFDSNVPQMPKIVDENKQEATLIYEITIDYYSIDNTVPTAYQKLNTEKFYIEYEPNVFIDGLKINTRYSYYKISTTIIAGQLSETGRIETMSGKRYSTVPQFFFEDGCEYLKAKAYMTDTGVYYQRTPSPTLSANSKGINNGAINFLVNRSMFQENEERDDNFIIKAEYTSDIGEEKFVTLTGKFNYSESGINYFVSFLPDDGQLNDVLNSLKIYIYVFGMDGNNRGMIISEPMIINNIFKLKSLGSQYYDIKIDRTGKTQLDFTKYFNSVSVENNRTCYKISISYISNAVLGTVQRVELTYASRNWIFTLPDNLENLEIQVQDAQSDVQLDKVLLLYSDKSQFNLSSTSIEGLQINWNDNLKRFEWRWEDETEDEYEYYVSVKYALSGYTEVAESVKDNFYCPRTLGTIAENGFSLRVRKLNDENSLYYYSPLVEFTYEEILYDLFAKGKGTEADPYIIRDIDDFKKMALRNTPEFYFKLDNNISLEIDMSSFTTSQSYLFIEEFNAHFDGNKNEITIISNKLFSLPSTYSLDIIEGVDTLNFNQYSSLFYSLSSEASIKNIQLKYRINCSNIVGRSILFAPIALYNYGSISNVNIISTDIALFGSGNNQNVVFIGGITAANYGDISFCTNSSKFLYEMPQLNLTIGYAGITIVNGKEDSRGTITNCFNTENKEISVFRTGSVVYMAGIAILNNTSTISMCGNDADLCISSQSADVMITGYYSGIVIASNTGTLEFLYNNGRIINKLSSAKGLNFAGIAYQISGDSINALVELGTSQPLVAICIESPVSRGTCYVDSNSGTASEIPNISKPKQVVITCRNGYQLSIESVSGGYKASIKKAG